jgi:hypothetical protein
MNTSIAIITPTAATTRDIEIVQSPETHGELWVIVPAFPVRDWPGTRVALPMDLQAMQLVDHHAFRTDDGQCFDGWVIR